MLPAGRFRGADSCQVAGRPQGTFEVPQTVPRRRPPHREDEGKSRPFGPFLAQVPCDRELLARRVDRPIADEQDRIGSRRFGGAIERKRFELGEDLYRSASRIRTSVALVREPSSSASRLIDATGVRLYIFTERTGPRAATQALETTS